MMRMSVWVILLCLAVFSCKPSTESKPLPIQTMKLVIWDLMKVDEWYTVRTIKDSTLRKTKENIRLFEQVFAIHGITKDKFYTSYRYYEAHPLEMKVLVDSLDQFGSRERTRLFENHGQAKKP